MNGWWFAKSAHKCKITLVRSKIERIKSEYEYIALLLI